MLFGLLVLAGLYWFAIPGNLLPCLVPCREHRFLTFETQLKKRSAGTTIFIRANPRPRGLLCSRLVPVHGTPE
jgi:hypothetical protein